MMLLIAHMVKVGPTRKMNNLHHLKHLSMEQVHNHLHVVVLGRDPQLLSNSSLNNKQLTHLDPRPHLHAHRTALAITLASVVSSSSKPFRSRIKDQFLVTLISS